MVEAVSMWLRDSIFGYFITQYKWAWPAAETLHFIGMALLIGAVVVIDLRMLGVLKSFSFAPLHRLMRWGIAGFILNLITGFLFFAGDPGQYINNIAFQMKVLFIVMAGVNVLIFYLIPFAEVRKMRPGDNAPATAKVIAAASLFLWFGVMFWGRMLPFIGNAF
jgi:hypothetical protein